jgi:acetylglutamate kinase
MECVVVKLGGSLLEDASLRASALAAIASSWHEGTSLVVVHGGGKRIDAALAARGIAKKTHRGLRITDADTLATVVAVLAGDVNKSLVAELHAAGVAGAGISGADGETLVAELHPMVDGVDLGFVGIVTRANATLVHAVASTGFLPVVASLGMAGDGTLLNVNADAAAAALASALHARRLVFLTDVTGLLDAGGSLVSRLTPSLAEELIEAGVVTGGMQPKLRASIDALNNGVAEIVIAGPEHHHEALSAGKGGTHLVAA